MICSPTRVWQYLKTSDLALLFIEELGWEPCPFRQDITIANQTYTLSAIAAKHGLVALHCAVAAPFPPDAATRQAIATQIAHSWPEQLIIFVCTDECAQLWQWAGCSAGQFSVYLEQRYYPNQPGQALIQYVQAMATALTEDAALPLSDSLRQRYAAFVEQLTKRFFQRFKAEHSAFQAMVHGCPTASEREWYSALLLHRLMFLYFLQQRGWLDSDTNYLRNRLALMQQLRGKNQALNFYRHFLLRLLHEGLGQPAQSRPPDLLALIGTVPYFSGGLFDRCALECAHPAIEIGDAAFARIFAFFDSFTWVLDDRPLSAEHEINPDVLGYVFEQYINKKQMGAYYTQDDITGYIATATIIPFLCDELARHCPHAFQPTGPIWQMLRANPDRYIYTAARKGVDRPLPTAIAAGLQDVARRQQWNQPAPPAFGLPCETWRDHIARRTRITELRARIATGELCSINNMVTANLDLRQFALDIISNSADPGVLQACYQTLQQLSVLDPTCGSGAFLLAALKLLEPLYAACLERMAVLQMSPLPLLAPHLTLCQPPNLGQCRYALRKAILLNNLYGVDIMREAVEICKLRLFLALLAPLESPNQLEPLPDIDINIRAGNSLSGYATLSQVLADDVVQHCAQVDQLVQRYRRLQMAEASDPATTLRLKQQLRAQFEQLNQRLAHCLASDIPPAQRESPAADQPFQWVAEFYGILQRGGFDVIIGNPPYVMQHKANRRYPPGWYRTESCGNLYALVMERALMLLREGGRCGMILPIASVSTEGMRELQALYDYEWQWHSHFAVRPGKLFVGVDMNLTISLIARNGRGGRGFTTGYRRWSGGSGGDRPYLFTTLAYTENPVLPSHVNPFPKLGTRLEATILRRMLAHGRKLRDYTVAQGETLYYHSGGRYWRKALPLKLSSHYKPITVPAALAPLVFALLNSQLFYWYWISNSNCMDLVMREVGDLPVFALEQADSAACVALRQRLLAAYFANHATRQRRGPRINGAEINFDLQQARPLINEIDILLARYYGLNAEEQDFILNYDIKYRSNGDAA